MINGEKYKIGDLFSLQSRRRGSNFSIRLQALSSNKSSKGVSEEIHIEKDNRPTMNATILRKSSLINKFFERQETETIFEHNSKFNVDDSSNDSKSCKICILMISQCQLKRLILSKYLGNN